MKNPYLNKENLKKAQAKAIKLGVLIKPSTRKYKKLDVFNKKLKKIASIGDTRYTDFILSKDKKKRELYKKRHQKTRVKIGTPSYYADKILW